MSADIINKPFLISFQGEKFCPEEMTLAELDTLLSRVQCFWEVRFNDWIEEALTTAAWIELLRTEGRERDNLYDYFKSKGLWLCGWCKDRVYTLDRGLCDNCADLHRAEMAA